MLARKAACSLCSASRHSVSLSSLVTCKATAYRHILTYSTRAQRAARAILPPDFQWFPDFFSLSEQRALLTAALRKLDAGESRLLRRRRKEYALNGPKDDGSSVQSLFLPDELYDFQEVRLPSYSSSDSWMNSNS